MPNIEVKKLSCPCCGAPLSLKDSGYGEVECEHCHAIVYLNREDTFDGNMTIYNKADGKPLATIIIPIGWEVGDTFVNYNKCTVNIPYSVGFNLVNNMGSTIHVETGNSYMDQGPVLHTRRQAPHTIQKPFLTVDKYLDEYVTEVGKTLNDVPTFKEEMPIPLDEYDKQIDFNKTRQALEEELHQEEIATGAKAVVNGIYCDSACRAYECGDKVIVAYTRVYGRQAGIAMFAAVNNGINGIVKGIGGFLNKQKETPTTNNQNNNQSFLNKMADSGLLGGMLGKKFKTRPQEKTTVEEPIKEPVIEEKEEITEEQANPMLYGRMNNPGQGEFLEWQSDPVFLLITSKEEYKVLTDKALTLVCSSFCLSQEVTREHQNLRTQMQQAYQQQLGQEAQAQYQHGQALINIGQQRMQANYRYIDAMRARSNQQFEAQRSAYNSRMEAQDRMRDGFSEAIRGVNTYIRPDGKEVEVSVSADTAWINGKGEIVGGSAGFDPGYGWTKMDRKN